MNLRSCLWLLCFSPIALAHAQAPPPNDLLVNATPISGTSVSVAGSNLGASREPGEPSHAGNRGGRSVWWTWTAPRDGEIQLSTAGSTFDTLLAVYTGTQVIALNVVAADDDSGSDLTSILSFRATMGLTYRIAVDGYNSASGTILLSLMSIGAERVTLIAPGASWKYLDDGSNQGVGWQQPGFNDNTWAEGAAQLGYGDNDETTVISFGGDSNNKHITYYFRHSFDVALPFAITNLNLRLLRDDGAVVYLNGNEVFRSNMPEGPINFQTRAPSTVGGNDEDTFFEATVLPTLLRPGANVIAVEVHQQSPDSSDLSFDFELEGTRAPVATNTLVNAGADWRYRDTGMDLGTAWREPDFDDSAWSSGPAQLGYGDNDENTVIGFGGDPNNKFITTYFRRSFLASQASTFLSLTVNVLRDDGAVVYLNGIEVFRSNMPEGPITFSTLASSSVGGNNEDKFFPGSVDPLLLRDGSNLLAVELHQQGPDSSDLSFDLELVGLSSPLALNSPPVAQLTQPLPNSLHSIANPILLEAAASDPNGAVTNVAFFADGQLISQTASAPYQATWTGHTLGNHELRAIATDNNGARGTSAPVNITVVGNLPPLVGITQPVNNAVLQLGNDLLIQASASDPDGAVSRVEFFSGSQLLGVDTSTPYTYLWVSPAEGNYTLRAVAMDNAGASSTSAVVNVRVSQAVLEPRTTHIRFGATWRYLDDGSDQGTAWRATGFNDNSWASGPAELGYGDGDETTVVSFGPNQFDKYPTTYFRHRFVLTNPLGYTNSAIGVRRDDGAVVYLNGVEVFRSNMPDGPVNFLTPSASSAGDDGNAVQFGTINPFLFLAGNNVIAVEIHQQSPNSSDLSFDLELVSNDPDFPNQAPSIALTAPSQNQTFISPANVTLRAVASDADGRVVRVEFFNNGTLLGEDRDPPFELDWNGVPTGAHSLSAIAYDNLGASASSDTVAIEVTDPVPTLNDAFADRILLGEPGTYLGSNETASKEPGEPDHASNPGGRSAWWSFIAQTNGPIVITTAGSTFNTLLAIYTGSSVENLTFVAANDQDPFGGDTSRVTLNAEAGVPYQIAVDGFNAARGRVVLNLGNTPPTVAEISPAPGQTTNLSQITVTFSKPVTGVHAADLLMAGVPATGVQGSGSSYVFSFVPPAAGPIPISWAVDPRILDLAVPPNLFDPLGPGARWQYVLRDSIPPRLALVSPVPGGTLRSLDQLEITFSEPILGLQASDLLVNGQPATQLSGARAGPYEFRFNDQPNGQVNITWAANHGIQDTAVPFNPFAAPAWSYSIDSNLVESVVINEIMYHPASEQTDQEYVELLNTGNQSVELTGWSISRGVNFVFPSMSLLPGAYLVVAADVTAFQARYPGVNNVIGGWQGVLSNGGEDIEIENAAGDRVDLVTYADEGDWGQRVEFRQGGVSGWDWEATHDGGGRSLELRNPGLSNNNGQNWGASMAAGGSPGQANSIATSNVAPFVLDVEHFPAIPNSGDQITVTARVVDEQSTGLTVTLHYRDYTLDPPGPTMTLPMLDDGTQNDGSPNDNIYGAVFGPLPSGTVIDFYVEASDPSNNSRTWPAPGRLNNNNLVQEANAVFQVDEEVYAGAHPILRLIMTETERARLGSQAIRQTDVQMNATLISMDGQGTTIRYNNGVRIRGAGSRGAQIPNYRLNVPHDRLWNGISDLNLNAQYGYAQVVGSAISLLSKLPASDARTIQVRVNGVNLAGSGDPQYGAYALVEPVAADWAANHYPLDPDGNAYTARRPNTDLTYLGTDPQTYIDIGYTKQSNGSENDWSDLFNLTFVLNNTPAEQYVDAVREVANVEEWMTYFAMNTLLGNGETSLGTGVGDDYDMYRGVIDPRFLLVAHDWDTILSRGQGPAGVTTDLFRAGNLPVVDRFLRHPDFVWIYWSELKRLIDTTLSPGQVDPLIDRLLSDYVPPQTIENMKAYALNRNAYTLSQMPLALTVQTSLPTVDGFPRTSSPTANLNGEGNVLRTRRVLVNGVEANWVGWQGTWSINNLPLQPGINRVLVQAMDPDGQELERLSLDVWYDSGAPNPLAGPISGTRTVLAQGGPYRVSGDLIVPVGATLILEPGATLYFDQNAAVRVFGRLVAEGTANRRIRLSRQPGSSLSWGGVSFDASTNLNRLAYIDLEYAGAQAVQLNGSLLQIDHASIGLQSGSAIVTTNSSLSVRNSTLNGSPNAPIILGNGILAGGELVLADSHLNSGAQQHAFRFQNALRPGAIPQLLRNRFVGGGVDLSAADAHIEGNVFREIIRAGQQGYAVAARGQVEVVLARNVIYDSDHALLLQDQAFAALDNNTITRCAGAAISFDDLQGQPPGRGVELSGDILWNIGAALENAPPAAQIGVAQSLVELPGSTTWAGPGNINADPLFRNPTALGEQADFTLRTGSPALGSGPNGLDMGAHVPAGASISGEPPSPTARTSALLTIGGPGLTHYRFRVNEQSYSPEIPISENLLLAGLNHGAHSVLVLGKNSAGIWQSQPTVSHTWIVNTNLSPIVFSEVIARNQQAYLNGNSYPDALELHNDGDFAVNLGGYHLSDDPSNPRRFTFSPGTTLAAGAYLVLFADDETSEPGIHLGFNLDANGETLSLYSPSGLLLDQISFGPQLVDLSISRQANNIWTLSPPTLGANNRTQPTGDPFSLRINEWLTDPPPGQNDFIELFNTHSLPVALGGLHLTDKPLGAPTRHSIHPLSFIAGNGFTVFQADAQPSDGPDHVNFQLSSEAGFIGLLTTDLQVIDQVSYGPQFNSVSEGRDPSGLITPLSQPTPGSGNPRSTSPNITTVTLPLLSMTEVWRYEESGTDLGTAWRQPAYNDSAWQEGPALLFVENSNLPAPKNTPLNLGQITYYFRTAFTLVTNLDGFTLTAQLVVDDGVVLYLNGNLLLRLGVPNNPDFMTQANRTVGNAEIETFELPATLIQPGVNLLAAEVHQTDAGSSDIVWGMSLQGTRTFTNLLFETVLLNEILANNRSITNSDGSLTDWVELYNPTLDPADLAGLSLTDDLNNPRRWVFPPGATLAPDQTLVVRMDPDSPASLVNSPTLNSGFGLGANGETLYLFGAPAQGGSLLDSLSFGIQVPDFSLGRIPHGNGGWSLNLPTPNSGNLPATLGNPALLRINEWMANPASGEDWFEIYNPSPQPVALGGFALTDNLSNRNKSPIPALSFIGSGADAFLVFQADSDPDAGADHANFRLDGDGESLGLFTATANQIDALTFGAQSAGVSAGRLPDGAGAFVDFPNTASPGNSNFRELTSIVINEVLTHTDLPLEDAIELHNISGAPVDISGWFLSDSRNFLNKFRIPNGTILPSGGFHVFYENQFNPIPDDVLSFGLSSANGDSVWLSAATGSGQLTGERARVEFGPAASGVSFGRYPTSVGVDFTALSTRTFGVDDPTTVQQWRMGTGRTNAGPLVGPVVIREFMYHPPNFRDMDNVQDEYIQLKNISTFPVPLFDPNHPTNTWRLRDAVDFEFPINLTLLPGATLLVVSFDPIAKPSDAATFLGNYRLPPGTTLVGPYRTRLANSTDEIELLKPDPPEVAPSPDAGRVPYVLVDNVRYNDEPPWPAEADGAGFALRRLADSVYGNDPANWIAALPTPAPAPADNDNDGMPNEWEVMFGLNPDNSIDADLDFDGDTLTNLEEYRVGTDPRDPQSGLALEVISQNPVQLRFTTAPYVTYSIEFRNTLGPDTWSTLVDVLAQTTSQTLVITDPENSGSRFYRIRSPR